MSLYGSPSNPEYPAALLSKKLRELLIDEEKLDALVKSLDQVTAP